jgi:branched-chain amino acid transport system permease protein
MVALPTGAIAPKRGFPFSAVPRRGTLSVVEIAVLFACVASAASITNRYALDIMVRTFLWGGLALAWNIAGGYAGLISFGHAAFFGIGAYTSTILLLTYGVPPWIGTFAGAALAACAGAALTLVCARLRGPFFILSTLAAGEVTRIAALNWRSLTGGSEGLEIAPVPSFTDMVFRHQGAYVALVLAYMLGLFALSVWFERVRFGYYLFATRDNEDSASAIGINPLLMRATAMAISAALTAIGGTLFAQYFLYLDPTSIIAPDISFQFALICALGGLGTASGPVFGALIIVPLSELLRGFLSGSASGLHLVIYGTIVIAAMLYFPSGISGAIARLWPARPRASDSVPAAREQKPS